MDITTPFSSRPVSIAFSQIEQGNGSIITKMPGMESAVLKDFDRYQVEARTQVQMVTGNLIAGFNKFPKGRFVNFTTQDGDVRQGLMLPFDTDVAKELAAQPVKMPDVETSQAYLNEWTNGQGWLKTSDLHLRVGTDRDGDLKLVADSARLKGGKYYLDQDLCNAAEDEFVSVGGNMQMTVSKENAAPVLTVIQAKYPLYAHSHNDLAKERLGIEAKAFVAIEDLPQPVVPDVPVVQVEVAAVEPEPSISEPVIAEPSPAPEPSIVPAIEPVEAVGAATPPAVVEAASFEIGSDVGIVQADLFGGEVIIQQPAVTPPVVVEPEIPAVLTRDRSNEPIKADDRISAEVIQDFRSRFDTGLANPEAVEAHLFEVLPQALDADQNWQNVKWSDRSEDVQKAVLAGVIDRVNNTGDTDLQQLMSQPEFVDWLNNALFEADTTNLSVEYEFDAADLASPIEAEVYAQTITILDAAQQAFAFGADQGNLVFGDDNIATYAGKDFDFSYQPDGAVFTVTSKTDGVLVQTVDSRIDVDNLQEFPPALVNKFAQLSAVMQEHGVVPSTDSPAASYEVAIAMRDRETVAVDEASLNQWQEQAQAIGRSPEYMEKVAERIETALSTGKLTAKADEARQIDGQVWQDMVQGTIQNAEAVVESAGTPTASGKSYTGKIYRIDQTPDSLTIQAKDRGEILHVEQGAIATAKITANDAKLFQQQHDYLQSRQRDGPQPAGLSR